MTLYKIVVNGEAHGQDIQNYFAYRLGAGIDASILPNYGASSIAEEWVQEVMPDFLNAVSNKYTLQSLDVYTYGNAFGLVYSAPYRLDVNEAGHITGESLGPASCITYKANLEPMLLTEEWIAPKRGWVSVGPVSEGWFEDGKVIDAFWTNPNAEIFNFAEAISQNLEAIDPPALFYPVRLKQNQVLGVNTIVGYADIQSWSVDRRLKFRRSRQYAR